MTKTSKTKKTTTPANVSTIKVQRAKAKWRASGIRKHVAEQDVVLCKKSEWEQAVALRDPLRRWATLAFPGDMVVAIEPLTLASMSPAQAKRLFGPL